jgi:SAM-dependent methyltransferase
VNVGSQMRHSHWQEYHRAWSQLTEPLRPHQEVVSAVSQQLVAPNGRTLLLGITPELANLAGEMIAVDRNQSLIANVWPGNTPTRKAVVGDWRNSNFLPKTFSACIGDGSLSCLRYPEDVSRLLQELAVILRPGARFVCRLYLPPENPETPSSLRDAAMAGTIRNFHTFKLRLAMALAAQRADPHVEVDSILRSFNDLFADRDEVVGVTGWHREQVNTIDLYNGSAVVYSFPKSDQLFRIVAEAFPNALLVPAGTYELAERCPLLVGDRI